MSSCNSNSVDPSQHKHVETQWKSLWSIHIWNANLSFSLSRKGPLSVNVEKNLHNVATICCYGKAYATRQFATLDSNDLIDVEGFVNDKSYSGATKPGIPEERAPSRWHETMQYIHIAFFFVSSFALYVHQVHTKRNKESHYNRCLCTPVFGLSRQPLIWWTRRLAAVTLKTRGGAASRLKSAGVSGSSGKLQAACPEQARFWTVHGAS